MQTRYCADTLDSMSELREMFPTGKGDAMNWCFASTSGVHGDTTTLDEAEAQIAEDGHAYITLLVVQPRLVRTFYGQLHITADDVPYLRRLITSSVLAVTASQGGNLAVGR